LRHGGRPWPGDARPASWPRWLGVYRILRPSLQAEGWSLESGVQGLWSAQRPCSCADPRAFLEDSPPGRRGLDPAGHVLGVNKIFRQYVSRLSSCACEPAPFATTTPHVSLHCKWRRSIGSRPTLELASSESDVKSSLARAVLISVSCYATGGQQPSGQSASFSLNPFNYSGAATADTIIKATVDVQSPCFLRGKNPEPRSLFSDRSHEHLGAGFRPFPQKYHFLKTKTRKISIFSNVF
jgi:hypothetical protein